MSSLALPDVKATPMWEEVQQLLRQAVSRDAMEPPYDGVAELWWTNREALVSTFGNTAGQAAAKELLEDEAHFIDLPHSPLWFAYEYPQVNPTPEDLVAREHSSLVKLFSAFVTLPI